MSNLLGLPKTTVVAHPSGGNCSNTGDRNSAMGGNSTIKTRHNPAHAMIAGYLAGFSGTLVGFPLDSVKVWVQTGTWGENKFLGKPSFVNKRSSSISSKTLSSNATLIMNRSFRTVRALYSGVSSPLVTVGMVQSVNFATYDFTRRLLFRIQQQQISNDDDNEHEYLTRDSLPSVCISGSVAGAVTAVLTAPLLMIKINQQITGNSFGFAFREIFEFHRKGFGKRRLSISLPPCYGPAFVPHIFSESFGRAIYVGVYETSKRYLISRKLQQETQIIGSLSLKERMACASLSGIVCWASFFPFDALRNRMYHSTSVELQELKQELKQGIHIGGSSGTAKTQSSTNSVVGHILNAIRIMKKERAFYRGFSISIVRAGPVAACVLPVYDLTLERLASA